MKTNDETHRFKDQKNLLRALKAQISCGQRNRTSHLHIFHPLKSLDFIVFFWDRFPMAAALRFSVLRIVPRRDFEMSVFEIGKPYEMQDKH